MIYSPYQISFSWSDQRGRDGLWGGAYNKDGRGMHTAVWQEIFKERDHLDEQGVDGRKILTLMLTHCGPVTQICVFTLQLCKTD